MMPVGTTKLERINRLNANRPNVLAKYQNNRVGDKRRKLHKNDIDLNLIRQLAMLQCSKAEIASILGIGIGAVEQFEETWQEFADALDQGYAETKRNIRRVQLDMALSGSVPMLIWLGKQYLGQSDQHKVESKTEINITVQKAMDELKQIPREQLLEAQRLLSQPVIENPTSDDTGGVKDSE
jgi:hypothetical protein